MDGPRRNSTDPDLDAAMEKIWKKGEKQAREIAREGHGIQPDPGRTPSDGALEDMDQQQRSEGYRKSSVHDDISSTGQGHASAQFAHHHHHKSKLAKDTSHSVKKKSRKLSEKSDHMEDIQETAMPAGAPDQVLEEEAEEEEEAEAAPEVESSPPRGVSLSWMPDTGASAPALAMSGASIPRSMQPVQDPRPEDEAQWPSHGDDHKKGGVLFQIGDDDVEESSKQPSRKKHRKPSHVHKQHSRDHHEAYENHGRPVTPTEGELEEHDQEDIGVHRFEKSKISHHVAHAVKNHPLTKQPNETKRLPPVGSYDPLVDHTPHELFVEMDELQNDGMKWKETARWIKYEEDLEETGQWGKPHVAALDCHSVIELIRVLNSGICMLDFAAKDMPDLLHRVVETLSESSIISEDQKVEVLRVLLYRHEHVTPQHTFPSLPGLKRSLSSRSIQALVDERRASSATKEDHDKNHLVIDMKMEENLKRSSTQGSFKGLRRNDSFDRMRQERKQTIISCLRDGTEGCNVLVGELDDIQKPIVAFIRLEKALVLPNAIEVKLPVRFLFILLTPKWDKNLDVHEIGRSMSTMMADPAFHNKCYRMSHKQELLDGVSAFLDDAVVLPPGDWDTKNVLPVKQIIELKKRKNTRKMTMSHITENGRQKPAEAEMIGGGGGGGGDGGGGDDKGVKKKEQRNPLKRTRKPFGGVLDDIWHRYAVYKSDILDGLNFQCFGATIFIYFAALSGAIAFGGLMGAKTGNNIGISETLIISSFMGIVFSLLSGCPLIIVGVTGPVLLYDEALYSFTQNTFPLPFLNFRVFIGIWVFLIAMAVAAFEGSTLVRFFTKFTKDIFASLVSLLFIYEAIRKLTLIFIAHPLIGTLNYCHHLPGPCQALLDTSINATDELKMNCDKQLAEQEQAAAQPNTALLSFILMFCTFMIAWGLRNFRNSQFLGRTIRRALGDFGVPIAIAIMVLIDFSFGDTYTEKLSVPNGLKVTNETARGWFIPPMGSEDNPLPVWGAFVAGIPAVLLYLLLFMETHICQLIMMEKTKEVKGAGLHLDIVLLSLINLVSGMFGGPWICAATVRAVSHVSALTVMSTNNQPGVAPRVIGIKDQRVTSFFVSVLLGLSILMAPILKLVPFAVLFGVFLYMGFSGMNGVQLFDRVWLMLMPRKHHPDVSYVRLVSQPRMHLYTVLQAIGLAVLWVVKSVSSIALAFPFFVIMMIPYRRVLEYIFTEKELHALDGVTAGTNMSGLKSDNEEKDFYEAAGECPTDAKAEAPLHRALSTEEE